MCACVCVRVCVCVCVPRKRFLGNYIYIEVIITKLSTVTASCVRMHHVLIILTLTFIQIHTEHNHENSKRSIISESFQAMLINFVVKIA